MGTLNATLADLCRRSVTALCGLEHIHGNARSLVAVWLEWSGGGIQLRTAPDGWGLVADDSKPQPADLGKYGRLALADRVTAGPPIGRVAGVSLVVCSESPRPIGVRLETSGTADKTVIYSYDDDLLVGREVVAEIGDVRYEPLCPPN